MALLYRFVKMNNRPDTHVFTFIVTRSVTRDLERDVTSKELTCGYHRWAITFSRTDKVLGVYLVWRNPSEGVRVYVDFAFTLLNREHFSINEGFSGKQVKFSYDSPAQGNRNYIPVSDLYSRNFTDANGEFQLELTIANVNTTFVTEFRVPQSIFSSLHHRHHSSSSSTTPTSHGVDYGAAVAATSISPSHHHRTGSTKHHHDSQKFESPYFTFGGFDWNIAVYPHGSKEHVGSTEGRVSVYLNRLTGFDHHCRVRYKVLLGEGKKLVDSGELDDVSDSDGKGYGWHTRSKFNDLVHKGIVHVEVKMLIANTISEVAVTSGGMTQSGSGHLVPTPIVAQLYDRDKQAWTLKADCHSETVRLHMVYKDIHNVPRNHLRYVSWQAYLLRYHGKTGNIETVPLPGGPFSHYYAQENSDEGIIMETDVTVKEIREPGCPYLTDKAQMRVQVEWGESYLLFQATYHKYDDIFRMHNYQMKREICALQAENYGLERQLFSYQKSIAYAHSRGTYSDDLATPEGAAPVCDDEEDERHYYGPDAERPYSLGDRSLSTDTEYA